MTPHTAWPSESRRYAAPGQAQRTSVRVSVRATDPLVAAGLEATLRPAVGLTLVDSTNEADVIVAVPDTDLHHLLTGTTSRLVLVADDLRQAELWSAIEHGLIVLVPRAEVTTGSRLLRAIADAREGRGDLPAEQLGLVLQGLKRLHEDVLASRDLTLNGLSSRETKIIRMLAEGMDTAEIADRLVYSERTVKYILHNLLSRLNLHNRAHAVAYALRHGLI